MKKSVVLIFVLLVGCKYYSFTGASIPEGELHVRTEDSDIIERLKVAIPRPWEEIPFTSHAMRIPSLMTGLAVGKGEHIYSIGFKLTPSD